MRCVGVAVTFQHIWVTDGVGDLNTARRYLAGCGTQDAGLSFGGMIGGAPTAETEEYDGAAWSTAGVGDLNTTVYEHAGCGIQSAGLSFGGHNGAALTTETEEYI